MHGPALSGWLLVALCAAVGAYCLLRMRACAGEERRAARAEAVMGFGMAAMALPAAVLAPPSWSWAGYAALFGAVAAADLAAARRDPHRLHHAVGSLAMVYMALAMAPAAGARGEHAAHAAMAGAAGGIPVLTGGLLLYHAVYVLRTGARLVPVAGASRAAVAVAGGSGAAVAAGGGGRPGWATRPELTLVCRLSMGLAMLAMLSTL
ncbi:DUF5134 domain-containing protein [Streptomyces termitum]|uniref:DUF5134 domain-containing protein n=1 Tax=Streptomyces termitum TaxID=67368 RepID=A0A918T429_9ACTN|nr:DUF5134 domain-containing protein [Streptomyces termitum]GHA85697.1 DUF5134 domain-containing protein [Streptomyces termitum]